MFTRFIVSVFFGFLLTMAMPAQAVTPNEGYAMPTFRELSQSLAIMGGLDIQKDDVFDEYAQIMYCDLYKDKYLNDFEWNKIRSKVRSRTQEKKDYYRVLYEVTAPVILGRYDFEQQSYPLIDGSALDNVGVIVIYDDPQFRYSCIGTQNFLKIFPKVYYLSLDKSLTLNRLPMPLDEAQKLLEALDSVEIKTNVSTGETAVARRAYLRFRFRILGAIDASNQMKALFRGVIESIDFFADQAATKHIANIPLKRKRIGD